MTGGTVFLMYHELERAGRELCDSGPGYVRYVLAEEDFREHLSRLRDAGLRGISTGAALAEEFPSDSVAITFDDGCASDFEIAAPLLREVGAGATFYVVSGFLGRRGYMTASQVRELSDLGFEVGSHSHTHRYLTDLGAGDLRGELSGSKARLEDSTGRAVEHFSCPGGRWSRAVAEAAREAGYKSVATSRPGRNAAGAHPFALSRVAVMRGTGADGFARLCRAEGLLRRRAQEMALGAAKRLLGNSAYERLRGAVLD